MWVGGVRVVILDDKKRVLMVRQHHEGRDIWMVPGGGVEEGENSSQAGAREVLEETGLRVKMGKLIWHVEEVSEKRGQRFVNFFLAELEGGTLELGSDPEFDSDSQVLREVRFMSREEMCHLEVLYPEYLKDELWRFLEEDYYGYNAFKIRE
ncbi:NUDIX hydrolase [Anaerovorax odorimutans]|uniref:NUDIX hydrolase n=1 Tax=Anaerovorax odorimutans TaxID=109327 RepID=A0ABT1RK56_9FIRM|nr:NUDIX hydrolase [Anaerovorax odorimutans]MCQ4635567.1 NUDIX hydrolase [Anaerovorax odorimutans]